MSESNQKKLSNKERQRIRMSRLFIESAAEIIEEEGLDRLTIRNVADRAAFNSATLYNYFKNLDRLKFFAVLRYMDPYLAELAEMDLTGLTSLEIYKKIWMIFAKNAFENPIYYIIIFFRDNSQDRNDMLDFYYHIYPDIRDKREGLEKMLTNANIYDRSAALMEPVINDGYFSYEEGMIVDQIIIKVFHSLLRDINDYEFEIDTAMKHFEKYLDYLLGKAEKTK